MVVLGFEGGGQGVEQVALLLAEMAAREERMMARIAELQAEVAALKRTPQNSSLRNHSHPEHMVISSVCVE